jgi:hypothetical protein
LPWWFSALLVAAKGIEKTIVNVLRVVPRAKQVAKPRSRCRHHGASPNRLQRWKTLMHVLRWKIPKRAACQHAQSLDGHAIQTITTISGKPFGTAKWPACAHAVHVTSNGAPRWCNRLN